MDIPTDVNVECTDGPCGRSQYVILDPSSETVTHVVVGEPTFFTDARLVPLAYVTESTPQSIRLKCSQEELQALPLFSEYEYVKSDWPYLAYSPAEVWMGPLTAYWPTVLPERHEHLPTGELSIERGAPVEATDGHVGSVDEFVVEPISGHITHLVLREGHLWGRRDIMIPASEIDRIERDTVYLKLDKEKIGKLPLFRRGDEPAGKNNRSAVLRPNGDQNDTLLVSDKIRALIAELGSRIGTGRQEARWALVKIGAPAVNALIGALSSDSNQVRWEAAKALEEIGDPASAPALVKTLEDWDFSVRWLAAEGLILLGRGGVIPLLQALTTKPDSTWLREGAHHVLRSQADAEVRKVTAPVLTALEDLEPTLAVPSAAHDALIALEAMVR